MPPGPSYDEVAAEYRKVLRAHRVSRSFEACLPQSELAQEDRIMQEEVFEQRLLSVLVASQPDIASGVAGAWLDVLHTWLQRQDAESRDASTILTGLERLEEYVSFFAGSGTVASTTEPDETPREVSRLPDQPPGLPAADDAYGWQDLFESSWSLATLGNRRWSMSELAAVREALRNPVHPKRPEDFASPSEPPAPAGPLESIDF